MKTEAIISLDGHNLCPSQLYEWALCVARTDTPVKISLSQSAEEKVQASAKYIEEILLVDKPVYGVNTGFGKFAEVSVSKEKLAELQKNLILSHCCGVGEAFERSISVCAAIIRINVIARGNSGLRPKTLNRLIESIEKRFVPIVPSQGSVGASGDLAPSAHYTAALMGYGEAELFINGEWKRGPSKELLKEAGLKELELGPKEGLALINGTQFTASYAVKALHESKRLVQCANTCLAMNIDGLKASHNLFSKEILSAHTHKESSLVGNELRNYFSEGSTEISSSHENCGRVQDPYSLRCAPQVHGAVLREINQSYDIIRDEINCSTDNPLIFAEEKKVLSGGNFHAINSARVCDRLASALTTLSNISERRTFLALSPDFNGGLPAFLIQEGGLNSGFMMAQVTSAALVSESKSLSFPASVDSIPTSDNKEDHVSMGPIAGKKLNQIVENTWSVLAIEFMIAAQAIELQRPLKTSTKLESLFSEYRKQVATLSKDRYLSFDIENTKLFLKERLNK